MNLKNQTEFIKKPITDWGFKHSIHLIKRLLELENLIENHKFLKLKDQKLDFDIDGLVYKINGFDVYKKT